MLPILTIIHSLYHVFFSYFTPSIPFYIPKPHFSSPTHPLDIPCISDFHLCPYGDILYKHYSGSSCELSELSFVVLHSAFSAFNTNTSYRICD